MFGIEIVAGKAVARTPGVADLDNPARRHPMELVERALWEVVVNGGNVSAACRSLQEQGVVSPATGKPLSRETIGSWKRKVYRNRYEEIRRRKVMEIDDVVAAQAMDNALQLGDAAERALAQTLAGLSGANGVEASTILRNIAQARGSEIHHGSALRGRDAGSRVGRGLEAIAKELAGLGPNIVKVERENPDSGVIEAEAVEEEVSRASR